jgi:outer membrane protein OmpA-like peptidoglycan-associated protein/tetratricopeptide (TPR) repeat protein
MSNPKFQNQLLQIKTLLVFFLFVSFSASSLAQFPNFSREQRLIKKADDLYQQKSYTNAVEKYKEYISKYQGNPDIWFKIANSYKELGQPEKSVMYYNRIISTDELSNPIVHLSLGQVYMMQGKYDEARKSFQRYNELLEYNDQLAMRYISSIENIDKYFTDSSYFTSQNLPINSPAADFSASSLDKSFYFLSTRNNKADDMNAKYSSDLFVTKMNDKAVFNQPQKVSGQANSRFGEIGYAINPETNEIFICRYEPGKQDQYSLGYNLYKAFIGVNHDISKPEKFQNDKFKYAIAYPTLSHSGKFLIFASDAPGGFGGWDLYKADYTDHGFENVQNLGEKVNSAGDELYPFLINDSILFYSTDGQGGLGGYDIYSKNLSKETEYARNLGYPINSSANDYGVFFDSGLSGYFTSNRDGGKGNDDIYNFSIHQLKLSGEIVDQSNGEDLKNVKIDIKRSTGKGEALALADNGKLILVATPGEQLEITVEKEGYEKKTFTINTSNVNYVGNHQLEIGKLAIIKLPPKEEVPEIELNPEYTHKEVVKNIFFAVQVAESKTKLSKKEIAQQYSGKYDVEELTDGKYYIYVVGRNADYFMTKEVFKSEDENGEIIAFKDTQTEKVMKALKEAQVDPAEAKDPTVHEFIGKTNQVSSWILYYGLDMFRIPEGSSATLAQVVDSLMHNPQLFLEIATHTDKRGSDLYNRALSEERAKFLYDYFIAAGISEKRIISHGIGEKQLKNYCTQCTEEQHKQNRRGELILREYKEQTGDN